MFKWNVRRQYFHFTQAIRWYIYCFGGTCETWLRILSFFYVLIKQFDFCCVWNFHTLEDLKGKANRTREWYQSVSYLCVIPSKRNFNFFSILTSQYRIQSEAWKEHASNQKSSVHIIWNIRQFAELKDTLSMILGIVFFFIISLFINYLLNCSAYLK